MLGQVHCINRFRDRSLIMMTFPESTSTFHIISLWDFSSSGEWCYCCKSKLIVFWVVSIYLHEYLFNLCVSTWRIFRYLWAAIVDHLVRNPPSMRETWVRSLGWEGPLEKGKATHFSILAWTTPWTLYSFNYLA